MNGRLLAVGAGLLGVGGVAHLAPGATCWRRARNVLLPALAGVGDPGHVALTFDDGPDRASTPEFLDVLDSLGWRATFFMLGSQVRRDRSLAAEVAARGHEVAVHGDEHASHIRRAWTWTTRDVAAAVEVIAGAAGSEPVWFRPPYGALSASSLVASHRAGLRTVLWTTWGRDWRPGVTSEDIAASVRASWQPGATVLLHDSDVTSAPGSWKATLAALPALAEGWAAAGLRVGTLSEHGISRVRA